MIPVFFGGYAAVNRPVLFLASGLAAALFAACYLQTAFAYLLPAILTAAGIALLFRRRRWSSAVLCAGIGMAFGLMLWYGNLWLVYNPAAAYDGASGELQCRAAEYPAVYERYTAVAVRAETLSGEKLRPMKILLYLDGDWGGLRPGDRLTASVKLSVPENRYDFDRFRYYRAHRIYLTGSADDAVMEAADQVPLRYLPGRLTRACTEQLQRLVPAENAAVLAGLIFGDVSGLSDRYVSDLRTTGLSHITAVSGMNVSFLIGLILLLFRRRAGTWIAIPTVVLFILMTGGSASVTRAGIMQILWLVASLIDREADPMNSLFLACGLILTCNPFAVADVGLWLSFAATLGLMLFSGPMLRAVMGHIGIGRRLPRRILEVLIGVVCTTLSAQITVLPIQVLVFGNVSLISPLSNLLIVPASEYAFTLGVTALLLSFPWLPLGWLPALAARLLTSFQLKLVPWLAGIPLASVSADSPYILMLLAFLYLLGLYWYLCRPKRIRTVLLCAVCGLGAAVLCAVLDAALTTEVTIADTLGGQSVIVCSRGGNAVINCGGGSRASDPVMQALRRRSAGRVDLLILTDYRSASAGGAEALLEDIPVKTVLLPEPAGEKDAQRRSEIADAARLVGTKVLEVPGDLRFSFGRLTLEVYENLEEGRDFGRLMPILALGEQRLLYLGAVYPENIGTLLARSGVNGVNWLAAGDVYAGRMIPPAVLRLDPELCVFSSYTGADREVLSRVAAWDIGILETDRGGYVRLRLTSLCDSAKYGE